MWLPLVCPLLGTWPTTQTCALTGNQTSNTLVRRLLLNPEAHRPGRELFLFYYFSFLLPLFCFLKLEPHPHHPPNHHILIKQTVRCKSFPLSCSQVKGKKFFLALQCHILETPNVLHRTQPCHYCLRSHAWYQLECTTFCPPTNKREQPHTLQSFIRKPFVFNLTNHLPLVTTK